MKRMALVMYLLHASVEFRRSLIHNRHTLVGLVLDENEKDYSENQKVDEQVSSGNATITETSELLHLESFIAQMRVLKCREEKDGSSALGDAINNGWPLKEPPGGSPDDHIE